VFSALAVLALLLAGTNYMNLSTARFSRRSREVGIRKVLGSNRKQLVIQFLGESILISLISTGLAWLLVLLALPVFSRLADRTLSPGLLAGSFTLPVSIAFAVAVGVLAGLYPALFLSALRPAQSVKGRGEKPGRRTLGLRRILVILQLAGSAAVLLGTMVIARQMSFLRSRELGFDKERVLVIHRASAVGLERAEAFKRELLRLSSVQAVSHTDGLPGGHFEPNGISVVGRPLSEQYVLQSLHADDDFDAIIGLRLEEGRYFSPELSSDPDEVVINRTAARQLAFNEPLGQRFYKTSKTYYTVVGVVADFNFFSLHHEILPMAIRRWDGSRWYYTAVRLRPGPLKEPLAAIERAWKDFTGGQPFEFSFLDSDFDALYRGEMRTGRIFSVLTGTAILIACLGLFGLVSFTAQRRTKEIGVRKVLGASSARMVLMLSREVICLTGLSALIALPPAAWAMHRWLRNFAYRIGIGPGLFAAAGLIILAVALVASAWQTIRTARENPADVLRCE
jgi:putative ABC transport system permease protein